MTLNSYFYNSFKSSNRTWSTVGDFSIKNSFMLNFDCAGFILTCFISDLILSNSLKEYSYLTKVALVYYTQDLSRNYKLLFIHLDYVTDYVFDFMLLWYIEDLIIMEVFIITVFRTNLIYQSWEFIEKWFILDILFAMR